MYWRHSREETKHVCCGVFAATLPTTWWTPIWVERAVFCAEWLFGVSWGVVSSFCLIFVLLSVPSRLSQGCVCCLYYAFITYVRVLLSVVCLLTVQEKVFAVQAKRWACMLLLLRPDCWAQLGPLLTGLLTTTGLHE